MSSTSEPLRGLKIGVMPFLTLGHEVGRRQDLLDRRPELLVGGVGGRAVLALPGAGVGLQQLPVGLELLRRLGVAHPVADIGLAVDAAVGHVGRAGPHLGGLFLLALQQHHELVVLDGVGPGLAQEHAGLRQAHLLDHGEVLGARESLLHLAVLVLGLVVLGIDDQPDVDAAIERFLQRLGHGLVAELVEAAEQRVARGSVGDELQDGLVELAAQPFLRLGLLGALELAGLLVAELARVGLAAGDAAIEEDVVLEGREQRLGLHADRHRLSVRSSFLGVPLSGWKTYSYLWSGLAVKSSHTKLCTGWREVFTLVFSSGLGISEGKTLKPKA